MFSLSSLSESSKCILVTSIFAMAIPLYVIFLCKIAKYIVQ